MPAAPLHSDESNRLRVLRELEILDTTPEGAYDDIVKLASRLCEVPIALISLVDENRQWFKAAHGIEAQETPRAFAFCAHAILTPTAPLIVSNAQLDPRFADNPLVLGEPNIRFYAGIPLVTRRDQVPIGTLCVISDQAKELSDRQYEALSVLANHAEKLIHLRETMTELVAQQRLFREQEHELMRVGRVALAGEMVAEVSHEIGQPLNAVSALAATLEILNEQEKWDRGKATMLIGKIHNAVENAGAILTRLRQFVRKEKPKCEICDLNRIVNSTVDFLDFKLRRKKVKIQLDLDSSPVNVLANESEIQQVLVNLMVNSVEAMDYNDTSDRTLFAKTRKECGLVVVEISDSGPGLQIDQEVAFAAFHSTKSSGLGMGLSICSRIIRSYSGKISGYSRKGAGATFRFELPSAA